MNAVEYGDVALALETDVRFGFDEVLTIVPNTGRLRVTGLPPGGVALNEYSPAALNVPPTVAIRFGVFAVMLRIGAVTFAGPENVRELTLNAPFAPL